MSYQVTARKWRPQTLDELVGQTHIAQSLKNAIQSGRIAHAYLFSGPRGVGKTSAARIFAKSINCEKGSSAQPCQGCSNCVEISNGTSYDVLEIDGASNRGIDQIRELRENVKYVPNKSPYKIFIIDEVHMLTDQAFNALLKTLEEPPDHVIFIFATTEVHKVKIPIRSRCQHYHFKRIPTTLIQKQLQDIAKSEGLTIEDKALFLIAKAGDGSMRDSQSLFDQVIAYSDKDITSQQVHEILGILPEDYYHQSLDHLVEKDIIGLIQLVARLIENGEDLSHFTLGLIETFRHLLIIIKCGEKEAGLLEVPSETIESLKKYTDHFSDQQIIEILNLLIQLNQDLKKSIHHQYLFESYLYRLVNYENFIQPSVLLNKLTELEARISASHPGTYVEEVKSRKLETPIASEPPKTDDDIEDVTAPKKNQDNIIPISSVAKKSIPNKSENPQWDTFKETLSKEKPMLASFLMNTVKVEQLSGEIKLTFNESFYFEEVTKAENIDKMEQLFTQMFDKKVKFDCILIDKVESDSKPNTQRKDAITSVLDTFKGEIVSGDKDSI